MTTALHISLPEIAALARVQRPVVSMWRTRFAEGPASFPSPLSSTDGREVFDAVEVAQWLHDTSHGNNPEAIADAAAFATIGTASLAAHREVISALLALRAADGLPLTDGELTGRALHADPEDLFLAREVQSCPGDSPWPAYVEAMVDAAYSPEGAWQRMEERIIAPGSAGSGGPISTEGSALLTSVIAALAEPEHPVLSDAPTPLSASALFTAAARATEDAELHVPGGEAGRGIRRLLRVHGLFPADSARPVSPQTPAVFCARLPGRDPATELAALESLVLDLSDTQRAVVVGPDSILTEHREGEAASAREFTLRTGRVRAIVRLPAGLVPTAPRMSLAVWVIGGPQGGMPLADRFTVVGDLRGLPLTRARQQDLVSDLAASLGSAREAWAHAFRFVRFVRTSTLIASDASLVAASPAPHRPRPEPSAQTLPALIDEVLARLDDPFPVALVPARTEAASPVTLDAAQNAGIVRIHSGARLHADDTHSAEGFPVLGRAEVQAGAASDRRIDRMQTARKYPRAELTHPGDVVFLAGSDPAAVVDVEGASVVEYPARILRLRDETLVPEMVAADINAVNEPLPWRRWVLRRIPPGQSAVLRGVLADARAAREAAERRAAHLRTLETLVMSAVSSGVLAASDPLTTDRND